MLLMLTSKVFESPWWPRWKLSSRFFADWNAGQRHTHVLSLSLSLSLSHTHTNTNTHTHKLLPTVFIYDRFIVFSPGISEFRGCLGSITSDFFLLRRRVWSTAFFQMRSTAAISLLEPMRALWRSACCECREIVYGEHFSTHFDCKFWPRSQSILITWLW